MTRETITIISPHQDDAALSLGNFIFNHKETSISIINCFTVTDYSPLYPVFDRADVMRKRRKEDVVFRTQINKNGIQFINLDEPDGPIRLNTRNMDAILTERNLNYKDRVHLSSLCKSMAKHLKGLLILPLGVGGHVDHNLACLAGISLIKDNSLIAFYLDVPYWLRSSLEKIKRRIQYIENLSGSSLTPYVEHSSTKWDKKLLSKMYTSQITKEEAIQIVAAPFMGEILLATNSLIPEKLALKEIEWTDLNL